MLKFYLFLSVFLVGCASMEPVPKELALGLRLAKEGKKDAARAAFELSCKKENMGGCFLAGKPMGRDKLRPLAILQGITSFDTTQINVLSTKDEQLEVTLWHLSSLTPYFPVQKRNHGNTQSNWVTTQFTFSGLKANVPYTLVVREGGKLRDTRMLMTRDLKKKSAKVAVASCMFDGFGPEQKTMWSELASHNPDYVFLIGDNVYADFDGPKMGISVDAATLWRRYAETRNRLHHFRNEMLYPTVGLWDDHDYGLNNGDRTYKHREQAGRIFSAFFAQSPVPQVWANGKGVGGRLAAYGREFLFLDNRFFRSPEGAADETHFGTEQEEWLWKQLGSGSGPAWIVSGDQFFGGYHKFESYERQHPKSFKVFLRKLKETKRPVAFLSGDRHLLEFMKIEPALLGYTTYEITTSGIHAKVFPGSFKKAPNKRRIGGADDSLNYLILEPQGPSMRFRATGYGPGKRVLFSKRFSVRSR